MRLWSLTISWILLLALHCLGQEPGLSPASSVKVRRSTASEFFGLNPSGEEVEAAFSGPPIAPRAVLSTSSRVTNSNYPFGNNVSNGDPIRLAITIPITSRNPQPSSGCPFDEDCGELHDSHTPDSTAGRHVKGLRVFNTFLPSFFRTIGPCSFPISFEFFFGYDADDPVLDTDSGLVEFRRLFSVMTSHFESSGGRVAQDSPCPRHFSLAFRRFNSSNTLTALWNVLNQDAYGKGCHYFWMPNDDLYLKSDRWPEVLIAALYHSPTLPNLGVTGPVDPVSGRGDMTSMPMVHRTHIEIFEGWTLPKSFQNWYNDVWLGNVYRPVQANMLQQHVLAENHHGCLDRDRCSRYVLGEGALAPWREEVQVGRLLLLAWLRSMRGIAIPTDVVLAAPITLG